MQLVALFSLCFVLENKETNARATQRKLKRSEEVNEGHLLRSSTIDALKGSAKKIPSHGMSRSKMEARVVPARRARYSSEEKRHGVTLTAWRGPPGKQGFLEPYVYDPTAGYEPYWVDGHWVFKLLGNLSSTRGPNCDFTECPEAHVLFGPICAINKHNYLKPFDNYCEMLLDDCQYQNQFTMAYRGKCYIEPNGQYGYERHRLDDNMYQANVKGYYIRYGVRLASAIMYMSAYSEKTFTTLTFSHFTRRITPDLSKG